MVNLSIIKPLLKERGIKIKEFCKNVGITEQGLIRSLRANSTKLETLELMAKELDIPITKFFTDDEPQSIPVSEMSFVNVPVVPIYAHAGYLHSYGDMEYMESLPTMPVLTDRNFKGNYMIFEVNGDSMDDGSSRSLASGDKVLAREIRPDLWVNKLHINSWYFIIVHRTEGILVKQIIDHNVERGEIVCHSLNPVFEDFTINLSDVSQLYNVISIVSREMHL